MFGGHALRELVYIFINSAYLGTAAGPVAGVQWAETIRCNDTLTNVNLSSNRLDVSVAADLM